VDAGSAMPDSSPKGKWIRNISAMAAFSVAGTLTGCGAADEAHEKAMSDQIAGLKENLSHCQDNNLEVGDETVLLSYGTFGLKMLKAEKENRFSIGKNSEVEVEQTFLIWPPVTSAEEIIVEGMAENFPTARLGSYWAVVYKSKVPQNKESLVIEVRKKRFVIFIDRK
jgi:hypothetical protein